MEKDSRAKQKLISALKKRDPSLSDKDISDIIDGLRRFVLLTQRIYTEPQAQIKFAEKKLGKKIVKQRVINTDYDELLKVRGNGKVEPISNVFQRFNQKVTKDRYGR